MVIAYIAYVIQIQIYIYICGYVLSSDAYVLDACSHKEIFFVLLDFLLFIFIYCKRRRHMFKIILVFRFFQSFAYQTFHICLYCMYNRDAHTPCVRSFDMVFFFFYHFILLLFIYRIRFCICEQRNSNSEVSFFFVRCFFSVSIYEDGGFHL